MVGQIYWFVNSPFGDFAISNTMIIIFIAIDRSMIRILYY